MRNRGLILLFLPLWLAACSTTDPVVRTKTVTVEVPVLVALPPELTTVAPEPARPAFRCRDRGEPTLCNRDLPDYLDALRAWGRTLAAQLGKVRAAQPAAKP